MSRLMVLIRRLVLILFSIARLWRVISLLVVMVIRAVLFVLRWKRIRCLRSMASWLILRRICRARSFERIPVRRLNRILVGPSILAGILSRT